MKLDEQRRRAVLPALLLGFPGPELPDQTAAWLEQGLAGVVIFARNITSTAQLTRLCERIRSLNPDALIAFDEEGGEVTRLQAAGGSSWPGARALGAAGDIELTRESGRLIAEAIAFVGGNVNLAPVADVDVDGTYVFANRTFSTSAAVVGEHVGAFVEGTQAAGIAACVKHFPGHGATTVDSHLDLPEVEVDLRGLFDDHLAPFVSGMRADAAMFMAAHVRYPQIDELPATISARVLTDIARGELGFEGVITTDALEMGAIADHFGVAPAALASLNAGADLLCLCSGLQLQREVVCHLGAALGAGEVSRGRLEQSAARVSAVLGRYAAAGGASGVRGGYGDIEELFGEAHELGLTAARRALGSFPLPAPLLSAPHVVELSTRVSGIGEVRGRLTEALKRRDPGTSGGAFAADQIPAAEQVLATAGTRPIVIGTRDACRHPAQRRLVCGVLAERPDTIVVGLGLQADASLAPGRFVPALGTAPPNLTAVAEALLPEAGR